MTDATIVRRTLPRTAVLGIGVVVAVGARIVAGSPAHRAGLGIILGSAAIGVVEEAIFRGLVYGALERLGSPTAIAGAALAFALVHVGVYGVASIPIDFAAGLVLGWQRWASGGWGPSAITHAVADVLALI